MKNNDPLCVCGDKESDHYELWDTGCTVGDCPCNRFVAAKLAVKVGH